MPLAAAAIVREPVVTVLARPQFTEPAHLPVHWCGEATDGERLVEYSGRLESMSQGNPAGRTTREFLEHISAPRHDHALAHAYYTLLLEGVSESVTHELMRGQWGLTCSQRSQRSIDAADIRFVMPPAVIGDADLESAWAAQMANALERYRALTQSLMTRFAWIDDQVQRRRMARDAAGGVLPNSTDSQILVTGSAHAWRIALTVMASEATELEMRRLAVAVVKVFSEIAPAFVSDLELYDAADRRPAARRSLRPV
jgi:thymidylate synthase (FAD)